MGEIQLDIQNKEKYKKQRLILILAIIFHFSLFASEFLVGLIISNASAMIADSIDMFVDGISLIVTLIVVGRSKKAIDTSATITGIIQLLSAISVLIKIVIGIIEVEQVQYEYVFIFGSLSLAVNVAVVLMLRTIKQQGIHLKASYIFSQIDIYNNLLMIIGGIIGYFVLSNDNTHLKDVPDLVIASIIFTCILIEAIKIFKEVKSDE